MQKQSTPATTSADTVTLLPGEPWFYATVSPATLARYRSEDAARERGWAQHCAEGVTLGRTPSSC